MRLLVLLALVGCGKVENNTPDDAPVEPDGPDVPPDVRVPVWGPHTLVTVNRPGPVRNPAVTNDGLNIFYIDLAPPGSNDVFDTFQASRTSTATDFGLGTAITPVNVTGVDQRYVEISGDGLELYFTTGLGGPIMVSSRANVNAAFSAPVAAGGAGIAGTFPSISADKLSLYFIAVVQNPTGEFKMATRAAVGQPFSNPVTIPLAGAVEIFSSIEISADELSVMRAPLLTGPNPAPIVVNRRPAKNMAFGTTAEMLPELPAMTFTNSPFVSARFAQNDTEIWTSQDNGNTEAAFVSRLQ